MTRSFGKLGFIQKKKSENLKIAIHSHSNLGLVIQKKIFFPALGCPNPASPKLLWHTTETFMKKGNLVWN